MNGEQAGPDRPAVVVIPPGKFFEVGPVAYEADFCTAMLLVIAKFIGALHRPGKDYRDPGQRRLVELDAAELRRFVIFQTGKPLPPLRFVWGYVDGGGLGVAWDRA